MKNKPGSSEGVKIGGMREKMPYSVPQGYFDTLQDRLMTIPSGESGIFRRPAVWSAALAGVVAVAVLAGVGLHRLNTTSAESEEAIVEYLIETGVTLAQLTENY